MTNPIWIVKVRMFTTRADDPKSYRSLWRASFRSDYLIYTKASATDGFSSIYSTEGIRGLWKGTSLALVGVSNGAIQFMAYEELKRWGFEQKRKRFAKAGKTMTPEDDKLVRITRPDARSLVHLRHHAQSNTAYTVMSGGSKLFALAVTYPYQVIRSRLQVGPSLLLLVRRFSHILALHRIMPRRTYTLISPLPSNGHGKAKAFEASTEASE